MFWFIPLIAFFASILTFFSGFGLGTILLASLIWYYPPEQAIAITALVHLLNSLIKSLLNRAVDWGIILRFGISSLLFALVGSITLFYLSRTTAHLFDLTRSSLTHPVTVLSFTIGLIMLIVSLFEIGMKGKSWNIPLWLGGALSGFMGGLSGHQGALRSAFLVKELDDAKRFVSTSAFIGLITDVARNTVYIMDIPWRDVDLKLLFLTGSAAIAGVLVGTKLLKKVKIRAIQWMVSIGMALLGTSMMLGVI